MNLSPVPQRPVASPKNVTETLAPGIRSNQRHFRQSVRFREGLSRPGVNQFFGHDGEQVLYLHVEGDDLSLRAIRPADGVEETILTMSGASEHPEYLRPEYELRLAPNGRTALMVNQSVKRTAMHTVDLESGDHQTLADLPYPVFPSWSPDGTSIAVVSPRQTPWLLYTLSLSVRPHDQYLLQIGGEGQIELVPNWP